MTCVICSSFHCLTDGVPSSGSSIYKICGTPYTNQVEYVVIILASSLFGLVMFHVLAAGRQDKPKTL